MYDVLRVESRVVRGLAVLVLRELLGDVDELLPGPGLVGGGGRIGYFRRVEELLVVVEEKDFVTRAVADRLALVGEGQGLERSGVGGIHRADVGEEVGGGELDRHGLRELGCSREAAPRRPSC